MSARQEHGFTLLEVLVALAILGVAVVASIQGFAQGLRLLKLAGDHQQAMLLADRKVREIVTPKAGQETGEEEHAGTTFTWDANTTEVEAPELNADGTRTAAWHVYQIAVTVRWNETRQVQLVSMRTAPVEQTVETFSTTPQAPGPATPTVPGTRATTGTSPTGPSPTGVRRR
jgi:general secretion pathway protein I